MITGKTAKKLKIAGIIVACILACALAIVCAVLTERNKGTGLDGSVEDLLSEHDHDHDHENGEDAPLTSLYRIILPENASADLVSRVSIFKDALAKATSTEVRVLYEMEGVADISDCIEILVGRVDRKASKEIIDPLRPDDYVCKWNGKNTVVIGGLTDSCTISAISYFEKNILPSASKFSLMTEEQQYFYEGEYPIDVAKINGYVLGEYDIVYEVSEIADMERVAKDLRDTINEKSGYLLDVVKLQEYKGGKHIRLKLSSAEKVNEGRIACSNNNITVSAEDTYALSRSIDYFCTRIFGNVFNSQAELTMNDGQIMIVSVNNPKLNISVIDAEGNASSEEISNYAYFLKNGNADVAFSKPVSKSFYDKVVLSPSCESAKINLSVDRILPIYYSSFSLNPPKSVQSFALNGASMVCCDFNTASGGETVLAISAVCTSEKGICSVLDKIKELSRNGKFKFVAMIYTEYDDAELPELDGAVCLYDKIDDESYAIIMSDGYTCTEQNSDKAEGVGYSVVENKFVIKKK